MQNTGALTPSVDWINTWCQGKHWLRSAEKAA